MSNKPVMEPTPKNIGRRIKEARESAELSQRDLSKKTDLSVSQISRYENGKSKGLISLRNLAKIAFAVGVSIDELYFGKREFRFLYKAKNDRELIANCLYKLYDENILTLFCKMPDDCPHLVPIDEGIPFYCVAGIRNIDSMDEIERCFNKAIQIDNEQKQDSTKEEIASIKRRIRNCFVDLARKIT